ncbi:hypothetical protein HN51_005499 [Arachis hypogaea]|uniref:PGG domain-containing protein n=2 Tax=Arachis TaxID=3817 RepID=A0A445DEG7_ARAHY|nr:ankyrin repeat-containing protein ITN1-like [Arachis duranensis]RYR61536.1 hypothetical protein Ahy_A04g018713 [Arachis hypogaea]
MGPRAKLTFTKEARESHLIVATLIATVTFAATFTLPGGTVVDGELKGTPIFRDKASFKAFFVSNTIAMVMATSAAFIHLFSPLNKAKYLDYYFSETAFSFTLIAIAAMIVAFGTGTYVILGSSSIGISIITVGLSFFLVFRQVLNMSFGRNSILTFIKNLVNALFFPFLKFAAKPFGFYFHLFKRTYNPEGRITF